MTPPGDPDAPRDAPEAAEAAAADDGSARAMDRRTLVRLLVGLGIGVPVAVEGATFLGLVSREFGGGGDDGGDAAADTTRTPARRRIGVGDELLAATRPVERVTGMRLGASGDRWRFELTAEVRNDLDTAYEFRLGPVTTSGGRTVEGGASTGPMAAGTTATVTGRWDLPAGERPATLSVSAVVAVVGGETPRRPAAEVPLARVPVRG